MIQCFYTKHTRYLCLYFQLFIDHQNIALRVFVLLEELTFSSVAEIVFYVKQHTSLIVSRMRPLVGPVHSQGFIITCHMCTCNFCTCKNPFWVIECLDNQDSYNWGCTVFYFIIKTISHELSNHLLSKHFAIDQSCWDHEVLTCQNCRRSLRHWMLLKHLNRLSQSGTPILRWVNWPVFSSQSWILFIRDFFAMNERTLFWPLLKRPEKM